MTIHPIQWPKCVRGVLAKIFLFQVLMGALPCQGDMREEALQTAKKATEFLTTQVATRGGYLWRYSSDLKLKEGEGVVKTETIWVQPPGTPSIGSAFVALFDATGDPQFLFAALDAAEALRQGQMRSGGWQAQVEFEPERRRKWGYRIGPEQSKQKDQSSLDDDKTQSAIRFVVQLDRALQRSMRNGVVKRPDWPTLTPKNVAWVHEMAMYALDGLIHQGQYPNGAFPQVWTPDSKSLAGKEGMRASFPETWSRVYTGHQDYWYRYTLNDNLAHDVMRTLFLAEEVYRDRRYRESAIKLADFLVAAQLPSPQPMWAQQYSFEMQPIWARKFEPPAITSSESQSVIRTLMLAYQHTKNRKFIQPIPPALKYLERSSLSNGKLARFYELQTNRPLYMTKDYQLTYDDSDVPTHYAFKVNNQVKNLIEEFRRLLRNGGDPKNSAGGITKVSDRRISRILSSLDSRGAWVTNRGMRYHKQGGEVIEMQVAVDNLQQLAAYLSRTSP